MTMNAQLQEQMDAKLEAKLGQAIQAFTGTVEEKVEKVAGELASLKLEREPSVVDRPPSVTMRPSSVQEPSPPLMPVWGPSL